MAAKSRIDDPRMMKVRKVDGEDHYYCHTFSVREREKLNGLPVGYCELPMAALFEKLTRDAFLQPENAGPSETYKDFLDESLWHFAKTCKFRFKPSNDTPFFQIEISAPPEGRKEISFFNEEGYSKHLIGNGKYYSVNVLCLILYSPLFYQDGHFQSLNIYLM
jgi:hypothetical protein